MISFIGESSVASNFLVNQRYYYDAKTDSLIMLAKKDDPNSDESETSGESGDEDNDVKCEEWER